MTPLEARKRGEETVENLRDLRETLESKCRAKGLTSEEMGELWWLRSQEEDPAISAPPSPSAGGKEQT